MNLSMGMAMSLGFSLLFCSFSKIIAVDFPLGLFPVQSWVLGHLMVSEVCSVS